LTIIRLEDLLEKNRLIDCSTTGMKRHVRPAAAAIDSGVLGSIAVFDYEGFMGIYGRQRGYLSMSIRANGVSQNGQLLAKKNPDCEFSQLLNGLVRDGNRERSRVDKVTDC
jgi:hypothetical protein